MVMKVLMLMKMAMVVMLMMVVKRVMVMMVSVVAPPTVSWCFFTASWLNSLVARMHIDSSARYLRISKYFQETKNKS